MLWWFVDLYYSYYCVNSLSNCSQEGMIFLFGRNKSEVVVLGLINFVSAYYLHTLGDYTQLPPQCCICYYSTWHLYIRWMDNKI